MPRTKVHRVATSAMTRRQLLASAAFAPWLVSSSALGRGGAAPSDRVTMGFIGVGTQGGGHLTGGAWTYLPGGYLGRDDVQVLAVCDVQRSRRERAQQRVNEHYAGKLGKGRHRACGAYTDFREVLARDDIDAVLIATPIHWHALMTVMAAKAGKDVYCEKPTALTIRESRAMADAVRRYGRVFQAGTQQRSEYGGKFRRACELVRSGRIGQLKEVYAYRGGGGFRVLEWPPKSRQRPVPRDLDWELFLGPAPWLPYAGSAGAHMFGWGGINWGQHHYDIVQWALDADRTGPVELRREDGRTAYRYASGVVVYGCPYPGERVGGSGGGCFVGTKGRIAVDRGSLVSHPADIARGALGPDDVRLYECSSHSNNFLECVRTRKRPICDVETAHRAISVLLLGGIAERLARPLKWDPQREGFVNDQDANRLLSVAKREPWCI